MSSKVKILIWAASFVSISLACSIGANDQPPPPVTVQSSPETPSNLYYLSDHNGGLIQIWWLNLENSVPSQITAEPNHVTEFSVSPSDGRTAYVADNQLFLINRNGTNRQLLVDAKNLQDDSEESLFRSIISGLAWSPNGALLAFGLDGLNIYNLADGRTQKLISNEVTRTADGSDILPTALYFPNSWSPDGNMLLAEVGFFEGGSLAIYNLSSGVIQRLGSGIVCCDVAWSPDGGSVLVGSSIFGLLESGLWRYDSTTGNKAELVRTTSADGTLNLVGWPMQLENGDLQYFFANTASLPEFEIPLTLVRTGIDGVSGRIQLRPESWDAFEALWTKDGESVVVVQRPLGETPFPRRGPIVLIAVDGSPLRPLVTSGYAIQWGP